MDKYLLGFVMNISDGHPYHLYIRRPRALIPALNVWDVFLGFSVKFWGHYESPF